MEIQVSDFDGVSEIGRQFFEVGCQSVSVGPRKRRRQLQERRSQPISVRQHIQNIEKQFRLGVSINKSSIVTDLQKRLSR